MTTSLILLANSLHQPFLFSSPLQSILSIHQRLNTFVNAFKNSISPFLDSRNMINNKHIFCNKKYYPTLRQLFFTMNLFFRPDGWLLQSLRRQLQCRSYGGSGGGGGLSSSTVRTGMTIVSQIFLLKYFCLKS